MPYRKTGFFLVPRQTYLPKYARDVVDACGPKLDQVIAEIIRSLGRENVFLKSFLFDRLLTIKHPILDGNVDLKTKFIILLGDFLHNLGYISDCPVLIDFTDDPVLSADYLIDLMIGTRLPSWKAADLMGDFATIDILLMFFTEVLRRYVALLQERDFMIERFRLWIGSIGYKLLRQAGELTQAERSFFVVYCSTAPGSKGYITVEDNRNVDIYRPIAPLENKDPLVAEVAALAQAQCLSGPSTSHMRLISNADLEQLIYYYGPQVPSVKTQVGYIMNYGPFFTLKMNAADEVPWTPEAQLYGIMNTVQNFMVKSGDLPPFALRTPLPFTFKNDYGMVSAYPDDPTFRLWLTDTKDCSLYTWDYPSTWRRKRINSKLDGGSMDFAIADVAVLKRQAGGMQTDMLEIPTDTLLWLTPAAQAYLNDTDSGIEEQIILPGPKGPTYRTCQMTAFYARFGNKQITSAFHQQLRLPIDWFVTPNDAVVDYIASTQGLSLEERVRYTRAIEISHNCAVYSRVTSEPPPIDAMELVLAQLGNAFNKI